jgi:outer membrane immunogenic protein
MSGQDQNMTPTAKPTSAKNFREISMSKNIILGAITALLLGTTTALAADLPMKAAPVPAPIYDWTGFYIGVSGGGSLGASDHLDRISGLSDANGYNLHGFLAGGQVGYNWQVSNFVLGFEGDGSWVNEHGGSLDIGTVGDGISTSYTQENWVATARVRGGYAVDNLLFYVTGGYAAAGVQASIQNGVGQTVDSASSTRSGWTAGGGLEWGFAPNWSAKFEMLYMQFNTAAFNTVFAEGPRNVPLNDTIARFGINYRFGGGPVVAKY